MAEKMSGYRRIYVDLAGEMAGFDLAANAPHVGLAVTEGGVTVDFFRRLYRADATGVRPLDGGPAGDNHLSLIAHYAMSPGRGEPSGHFLPLGRLSGMIEGRNSFERSMVNGSLGRTFGNDSAALAVAAEALGGLDAGLEQSSGGRAWLFWPFPKVPMKLLFFEADDEFPAEYRLLFDSRATDFLEFEALGFLTGVFIREMCGTAAE
ncbi:MAG: DUF3786 domain-containing protein [Candidatus Adiutrix sp.]|jgi:hypothetical protein|nr:DUF3786 domain-containing protein [Candidatus Adiutrix sp.]